MRGVVLFGDRKMALVAGERPLVDPVPPLTTGRVLAACCVIVALGPMVIGPFAGTRTLSRAAQVCPF